VGGAATLDRPGLRDDELEDPREGAADWRDAEGAATRGLETLREGAGDALRGAGALLRALDPLLRAGAGALARGAGAERAAGALPREPAEAGKPPPLPPLDCGSAFAANGAIVNASDVANKVNQRDVLDLLPAMACLQPKMQRVWGDSKKTRL